MKTIAMNYSRLVLLALISMLFVACSQGETTTPTVEPAAPTSVATTPTNAVESSPTAMEVATPTVELTMTATVEPTAEGGANAGDGAGAGGGTPEPTGEPVPTITVPPDERPDEARLIAQPLPNAFVQSPLLVTGSSDPTFEQTLIVRLVATDGSDLAVESTQILSAELDQRGDYLVEIPFDVEVPTQALLQVYSEGAFDGAIEHLASTFVVLVPPDVEPIAGEPIADGELEQLWIKSPTNSATVSGGLLVVEGFGLASFEQTLQLRITAEDGSVLAEQFATVQSGEIGQPGPFTVEIPYTVSESQTVRVSVVDESPFINDYAHIASLLVTLEP